MGEFRFARSQLLAAAIVSTLGVAASVARAADAPTKQLPKISVDADGETPKVDESSSPKYTQPLRDTPQTITVIPSSVIRDQGATTLRDVLRNSPGITFQAGEGGGGLPGDQNFTMRGFSSRNSLFIDGVRDTGAYTRDSFNLEQVEVIKGPTGAIAGRSTTSGAINQINKTPYTGDGQGYSVGLGTDNYKRVTGDVNLGLNDSMALRLNAMYHDAEVSNRDVVENKRWGIAPSFALGLGSNTRFTLSYLYVDEDNVPDYGLPWGTTPLVQTTATDPSHNGTFATGAYNANPRVDQSNFYGLKDYDFEDVTTQAATVQFEHDFSDTMRIRNVLRYIDSDRDSAITAPRPPNRQLQRRTLAAENLTNLTDFRVELETGAIKHILIAGLELSREETTNRNSAQTTNQPPILDFFSPNPNLRPLGPMPANLGNPGPSEARTDNVGIYVLDTIALNEQWSFSAGVRRDDADAEFKQRILATGALTDLSKSDEEVTWNAAVIFKPVESGTVYVSYGTGFDPTVDAGTVGPGLSTDPTAANNINLDPEESSNLELGTKWDLIDGRLSLNAAVFRMEKTNVRTRSGTDPIVLEGEQRVDGIEVGASGMITDAWSIFGGAVYLDSQFEQSLNALEFGQELLLTPDLSMSLWTTYALPFGLTVGIGAQYTDDIVRARTVAGEFVVPDRVLIDAMASYSINDRISLRLNASNLGDKDYVDRFGGGHYVPGAGRTVTLTASFSL